jgi:hypothetical protein
VAVDCRAAPEISLNLCAGAACVLVGGRVAQVVKVCRELRMPESVGVEAAATIVLLAALREFVCLQSIRVQLVAKPSAEARLSADSLLPVVMWRRGLVHKCQVVLRAPVRAVRYYVITNLPSYTFKHQSAVKASIRRGHTSCSNLVLSTGSTLRRMRRC